MIMAFMMALPSVAQNARTFKGVVVDGTGEPMIGATVKVEGTTTGTITDMNGNFSISVPEGKSVEFSYLGYLPQMISNFSNTKVVLKEDSQQLEEVVVVGYGTQKKAHLTGSIATVPVEQITDLSSGNLASSLSGLVNGLSVSGGDGRPGENARLTIRQSDVATSFSTSTDASNDPLYVIDGFITTVDAFNNLDATMVENISVLKDASAAVYGSRAANGVILVTTKQGKIGAPKISYSGQFGITDEVARTKMLNSYNYGKIWNAVAAADPNDMPNARTGLFQKDELETMKGLNYDLLDKYWESALTQKHSINVSGATERANYYGGISYFTQDGNLGSIDYERWNYRAGVDLKISKWVKANLQVSGDYGEKNTPYNGLSGLGTQADYNVLLTRPRYIPEYLGDYALASSGINNTNDRNVQQYHYSTLQDMGNYSKTMNQNTTINAGLEYDFGWSKILKGLKMKFTYSKNITTDKNNQYGSEYKLYKVIDRGGSGNHLYVDNGYYSSADDTGLPMDESNFSTITVNNGNMLSRSMSRRDNYQMNFVMSYARDFGLHHVNGLFTIEKAESEYEYLIGTVTSPYPFTNGQSSGANGDQSTQFTRSESGTLSYVWRANYAYADKYLLELLVRTDASTKFAPENYWGTFPSLSAGWVMSQEEWFQKNVKWVDYLKVRGSFGILGRDNTTAWQWLETYGFNQDKGAIFGNSAGTGTGAHISVPDTGINRDAHWDKSYKANFGLDFNVLDNRLGVNLDAYYEWNRDMFMKNSADIPAIIGTQSADENFGEVDSWGVELSLNWRDKIGKDFKYRVGLNTGYGDNKVKQRAWESPISLDKVHPGQRSDSGLWGLECIGMFRNYQEIEEYFDKYQITSYLGLSKSDIRPGMLIYKDIRGAQNADGTYAGPDGKINNEEDLVKISHRSSNPWGGTLNLGASYKDFSISAQVSANWGSYTLIPKTARGISSLTDASAGTNYNIMEYTNIPSYFANNMFVYQDVLDAGGNVVAEQNLDAKYPNLRYSVNSEASTFWRVSGARVTLRNITLAYALPRKLVQRVGIESCRLNVTAQNVLSLYNPYPDNFYDPLSGSYGSYPNLRKITVGLNVSF